MTYIYVNMKFRSGYSLLVKEKHITHPPMLLCLSTCEAVYHSVGGQFSSSQIAIIMDTMAATNEELWLHYTNTCGKSWPILAFLPH